MLNLEGFMNIRDLKQKGWSVSAIAAELHLDRKTVRKHLVAGPEPYKRENPAVTGHINSRRCCQNNSRAFSQIRAAAGGGVAQAAG